MKTTWILGAGASISCSKGRYPNIDSIFSKAKEAGIISETSRRIKPQYEDVKQYAYTNFGKNILRKDDKIDIEELLTVLQISLSKRKDNELNVIYDKILNIIKLLFNDLHFSQGQNSEYHQLVNSLSKEDTIISFNWDLLLDDAFKRIIVLNENQQNNKPENQYKQFISDFTALRKSSWLNVGLRKPYTEYTSENGHYLKLHGSIDWYYCNNVKCDSYGKIYPLLNYRKDYYCGECNNSLQPLIIPPILNKQYEDYPTISAMWTAAAREIEQSNRLILWGYSLPPTDFYANWLLRQTSEKLDEVIIINPEVVRGTDKFTYNNVFLKRVLGPIRHKTSNLKLYQYYEEYSGGFDVKIKHSLDEFNL